MREKTFPQKVLIKGAGDLASGVAYRLWQAGFNIVMLELPNPRVVRRTVAFASAVFDGEVEVEGVKGMLFRLSNTGGIGEALAQRKIPVLVDPKGEWIETWQPNVLVDAILAKKNTGTSLTQAPIVIGLGPGFTAGLDVHAVVETERGHNLGKVYYQGCATPNTGDPGDIGGHTLKRLLRSPAEGKFLPLKEIGDIVSKGEVIAVVGDKEIKAEIDGLLRGLLYPGVSVIQGLKVGDIDPRGSQINYRAVSDKARSVAGGVLEAILHLYHR